MKYALLIHVAPSAYEGLTEAESAAITAEYMAVGTSPGIVGGEQLHPAEMTTTIRAQNGETLVTDGPFADTKEVFGGFFVLEAPDLDAALEVAGRIPAVRMGGAVEVRPVVDMS